MGAVGAEAQARPPVPEARRGIGREKRACAWPPPLHPTTRPAPRPYGNGGISIARGATRHWRGKAGLRLAPTTLPNHPASAAPLRQWRHFNPDRHVFDPSRKKGHPMDTPSPITAATEAAPESDLLPSERIAPGLLPRVLTTFDMVAIFICIVLFISNSALMTGAGPAAYLYWLLGFVTFLIPGAIVTGQLGTLFPGEGSIYLWTHKALGDFAGFFAGFCLWGSLVIMVAYLLGTFAVMTAVPLADQSSPAAVAEAVRLGFGGTLGDVLGLLVTLIFTGFFLLTTAVFNYSFARLLFVSGLDRRLPAALSRLNANRVPSVAVVVQSVLASLVAALIFLVAPLTLRLLRPADLTTIVYDVLQAALTVIWCVSMIFLFVDVVLIRGKYPERFARKQLAPGRVFHLCLLLGVLASSAGVLVIFTNPWVNLLSRRQWDLALLVLLLIAALGATVLYGYGYKKRQSSKDGPQ